MNGAPSFRTPVWPPDHLAERVTAAVALQGREVGVVQHVGVDVDDFHDKVHTAGSGA